MLVLVLGLGLGLRLGYWYCTVAMRLCYCAVAITAITAILLCYCYYVTATMPLLLCYCCNAIAAMLLCSWYYATAAHPNPNRKVCQSMSCRCGKTRSATGGSCESFLLTFLKLQSRSDVRRGKISPRRDEGLLWCCGILPENLMQCYGMGMTAECGYLTNLEKESSHSTLINTLPCNAQSPRGLQF